MTAQTAHAKRLVAIRKAVENDVAWSRGSDQPWAGDALTGPWLLTWLCHLAAYAPAEAVKQFLAEANADPKGEMIR